MAVVKSCELVYSCAKWPLWLLLTPLCYAVLNITPVFCSGKGVPGAKKTTLTRTKKLTLPSLPLTAVHLCVTTPARQQHHACTATVQLHQGHAQTTILSPPSRHKQYPYS
ncbi:hypothetical protein B0T19DRAFT_482566 [Cercophora scortea]|uniref:Uncharacterized protein n=1 Tax=Cercophora scortea TaxID=314031 RepID=A0AAE0IWH4_9PEZI|nr:hypothetical protein B0T19DRAFT_482566 [Cercophora scortea]